MSTADGVANAVETRRTHWRGVLLGAGLAAVAGFLILFAPQPAHADDGSPGLLGKVLDGVTSTVSNVAEPVVEPLPDVRDIPVVGGAVGQVVDSEPVTSVTAPLARLLDDALGETVGSLPVVGDVLGSTPVGDVTRPVSDTVDGVLDDVAGPRVTPVTPVGEPDGVALTTADRPASGAAFERSAAASAIDVAVPLVARIGAISIAVAAGAEGPLEGPVSIPGGITPTSAVTAGAGPIGLAAAVLGAGLVLLLARGRLRPTSFRAPPSPVYGTDTSPD